MDISWCIQSLRHVHGVTGLTPRSRYGPGCAPVQSVHLYGFTLIALMWLHLSPKMPNQILGSFFFLLHRFVSACSFPFYSSRFPKYESIHAFLYRSTEYHNVTAFAVFHRSFHPNSGTGDRIICHSRRLPHSDVSCSLHFVSLAFLLLPNIPFCPPVSSSLCISAS